MAREYFCAYHSYSKAIEPLTDAERGRLFTALLEYSATGAEQELRGGERYVYPLMREQIDRDKINYEAKCEKNRDNVLRRYTTVDERIRTPTKSTKTKGKTKEKAKEREKENTGVGAKKFAPPTPDDVRAYCLERENDVDAERFVDFYASKDWMIGKNKMKDWRAAVRTWERGEAAREHSGGNSAKPSAAGNSGGGKDWGLPTTRL